VGSVGWDLGSVGSVEGSLGKGRVYGTLRLGFRGLRFGFRSLVTACGGLEAAF